MHPDTVNALTNWQKKASNWKPDPLIDHDGICVPLCEVIGPKASIPNNVPCQPRWHPKNSYYQFDSKRFSGPKALHDLIDTLKTSCPGCSLYLQENKDKKCSYFQLRCNHYPIQHKSSVKFSPECFTKDGVPVATEKWVTSNPGFKRMNN